MTNIDKLKDCEVYMSATDSRICYLHQVYGELFEEVMKNGVMHDQNKNSFTLYGKVVKMTSTSVLVLLEHGILYNTPAINVRIVNTEGKKGVKK